MALVTYLDGWYDEEHDGTGPFRWMSGRARCRVTGVSGAGPFWLLLDAHHGFDDQRPVLSVQANDRLLGERPIPVHCSRHAFSLRTDGDVDLVFALDRTFSVPSDGRALGLMVRRIEIVDAGALEKPLDAAGWYDWEHQEYFPCRWMGLEAILLVPGSVRHGRRFAALPVRCDLDDNTQTLSVAADAQQVTEIRLLPGWHVYDLALPTAPPEPSEASPPLVLTFAVNRLAPGAACPADRRELAVRVGEMELHDDRRRHEQARSFYDDAWKQERESPDCGRPLEWTRRTTAGYLAEPGDGWDRWEFQNHVPFRWMGLEGRVRVPASVHRGSRFCTFETHCDYDDLSQILTVSAAGTVTEIPLPQLWSCHSLALDQPATEDLDIVFRANKLMPASARPPGDRRMLALRVGVLLFHDDEARHQKARVLYDNAVLNTREFLAGATVLRSYPQLLGIDLYAKCNIKPPCVYCWWEDAKSSEGQYSGAVVDDRTLEDYGKFFDGAWSLVNCSFGEPLLHPRLDEILTMTTARGKMVELSTNGQAFTPATIAALAGRRVVLYVSVDAASAAVYGRLRNDRWNDVIAGLTFLREARRRSHGLPKLNMVFMPMRANLEDLEAYFKLCRMVEADYLVVRQLTRGDKPGTSDRGGYHFEYERELVSLEEMAAIAERCREYSRKYGVEVADQLDFGRDAEPAIQQARS